MLAVMETPMQSCPSPPSTSSPAAAEPPPPASPAGLGALPTTTSAVAEPQTPVDVTPLGDSPSVGVDAPAKTTTSADTVAPPPPSPSVYSAGDPASPIEPPPSNPPMPAVVEAPPPTTTETAPTCPPKTDATPELTAVADMPPTPVQESPASMQSQSEPAQDVPPPSPKPDVEKTAVADAPQPRTTSLPPKPVHAKRPVKIGLAQSPIHQPSHSSVSSVTPTPSTSTVQSNATSPRSSCHDQPAVDDAATWSSYGSIKAASQSTPGSYLRAHQRRAGNQRREAGADCTASTANDGPVYQHERKSRSVSPTSQTDSYRSSTTTSTIRSGTSATVHDSRGRSPVPTELSPQPPPIVDWPRSMSPYHVTALFPRHVTEYRYCVAPEPSDVRPSRRLRENTHVKLFGADEPDSPRTAAAAFTVATGGLHPKPPVQQRAEDTQATLFGPPDQRRRSSRVHPDTHQSLFGPPPPPPHSQRRSRSCFHDTADLLHHDPSAGGRADEDARAVRGRYALRHQDTGEKLFGDTVPVAPSPTPKPQRDHDIFLIGGPASASIPSAQPCADPIASP